jgi:N-acyl-L-homoserine lactone synthetase
MTSRLRYTDGTIEFRELVAPEEIMEAYRFRYRICVERLNWVKGDPSRRIERDTWDDVAWHFGAFKDGRLVGYVRLTPDTLGRNIMSRVCFGGLFHRPDPHFNMDETGDISRLILEPGLARNQKEFLRVLFGLYRLAYGRARIQGIRYWYFVTSRQEIQGLRYKGLFPVRVLGHGVLGGKDTYVATLDLARARFVLLMWAPWRLKWYEEAARLAAPLPAPPDPLPTPFPAVVELKQPAA